MEQQDLNKLTSNINEESEMKTGDEQKPEEEMNNKSATDNINSGETNNAANNPQDSPFTNIDHDNIPTSRDNKPPEKPKAGYLFDHKPKIIMTDEDALEMMQLKKRKAYYELSLIYERLCVAKREKYKKELELLKMERELNIIEPSGFTKTHLNLLANMH